MLFMFPCGVLRWKGISDMPTWKPGKSPLLEVRLQLCTFVSLCLCVSVSCCTVLLLYRLLFLVNRTYNSIAISLLIPITLLPTECYPRTAGVGITLMLVVLLFPRDNAILMKSNFTSLNILTLHVNPIHHLMQEYS